MSAKKPRSEQRQRQRMVGIRVTPEEYATLQQKAAACGQTLASFAREQLLGVKLARPPRPRPTVDGQALGKTLSELNKVGSNLNQIAKALNTYGISAAEYESFAALAEVRSVIALVRGVIHGKGANGAA